MLRYRIANDPRGRHIVLPAWTAVVPLEETYRTRRAAEEMAEWFNRLTERRQESVAEVGLSNVSPVAA